MRRIRTFDGHLKAFIHVGTESNPPVRGSEGAALDEQALAGIPVAVKDLIDVAGMPTTAGSRLHGAVAANDAFAVTRLVRAGAQIVGKTNLHELALGVTNNNPYFGTCRNPWARDRISGGSSGGSAVAVATGMSLAALGTDTGGSIRIPAALCGVVGLKPTYGRVSAGGVLPLSWNLDHVGPITRTVRDAALIFEVIAGYDPLDPASADVARGDHASLLAASVRGWSVALASGSYIDASSAEVLAAVRAAAQLLSAQGAKIKEVELPYLREAAAANLVITQADAATVHGKVLREQPGLIGEDVRQRLEMGSACSAGEYARARRTQAEVRRSLELLLTEYHCLILPTTPVAAPPVEGQNAIEQARLLTRFTAPFNAAGLPALSVPCGYTSDGLPVGLQIVAAPWREDRVIAAGVAYEESTQWTSRQPEGGS